MKSASDRLLRATFCLQPPLSSIRALSAAAASTAAATAASAGHVPVLADEVARRLCPAKPGARLLDATFGAGGHTRRLLAAAAAASAEPLTVLANDRDPAAHGLAARLAESLLVEQGPGQSCSRVVPLLGKFSQLLHHRLAESSLDGALFDLGVCSTQFDDPARGFALASDGPLDMRMGRPAEPDAPTAADLVNGLQAGDLAALFRVYGEETRAPRLARAVVERRSAVGPFHSTRQLADCLAAAAGGRRNRDRIGRTAHPATRVFQALRLAVNDELNEIIHGLECARRLLKPGALCVAISFHSLEDRLVKRVFANRPLDDLCPGLRRQTPSEMPPPPQPQRWSMLTFDTGEDYLEAEPDEVAANPRARSAKLRVAVKLDCQ